MIYLNFIGTSNADFVFHSSSLKRCSLALAARCDAYGGVFLGDMHFQVLHFLHSYKHPNSLKATFVPPTFNQPNKSLR